AVALEVCAKVRLHWKDRFGCCALRKSVTTLSSSPTDLTFDQTTSPGGFFVLQGKRLRRTMEDLKKILYMI
ncbi:hypothetical protein PRR79_28535, partial [Klebsiella pneumoniae]|nr:hypothetical protein [Klebsiella pneumoniae]